jgi:hypothetical protein
VSLLLVVVLQLAHAGRRFTGNPWTGPVAAALILFVGDLDFGATRPGPLIGTYFSGLYLSPSQLLGMVVFLPTILVIADLLEAEPRAPRAGSLALLAVLLFGCAGAKATILPVLIGGLVVYAVWRWRVDRRVVACLALCLIAFAAAYLLLYSGGREGSALHPLRSAFRTLPGMELESIGGAKRVLAYPVATWVTAVALMVPLAGLAFARIRWRSPTAVQAWLLGLLAAAVAAFFAFDLPGFSQLYFLWYGFTAGALLAAGGLVDVVGRLRRGDLVALAAGAALGIVLGLGTAVEEASLRRVYMGVAAVLGVVVVWSALRSRAAKLLWPAVFAVGALLTAGLVDAPRDRLPHLVSLAVAGEPLYTKADPQRERGVTRDLARGLAWVRDHTGDDAVLAVNNHLRSPAEGSSVYFYYSALAERRVFIESWEYTDKVLAVGLVASRAGRHPFAKRLAFNDSTYAGTGPPDAAGLRRRGVDYVLVDRINAPVPRRRIPGRVVFRNDALIVHRL